MIKDSAGERVWGGRTMEDRRTGRRASLVAAGVELLAAGGGPAVTVRAVCRAAGLTERYFYESFPDRDSFVVTVFDELALEVTAAIVQAVSECPPDPLGVARAAVETAVDHILDQPAKGRVLFVALMTDPLLYAKVDQFGPVLAGLIRDHLRLDVSSETAELVSSSLAGALGHLFHQYVAGTLVVSRVAFVDHCVTLLLTLAKMQDAPTSP